MKRFSEFRRVLSKTSTAVVPKPGARPRGNIARGTERVSTHHSGLAPFSKKPSNAEHRQQELIPRPRASLARLKGALHKQKAALHGVLGEPSAIDESDQNEESVATRPGVVPATSRRADLLFESTLTAAPRLVKGALLELNGGQRLTAPSPRPLSEDTPELTMPGSFAEPVETVAGPAASGLPGAFRKMADAPMQMRAAAGDRLARTAFTVAVKSGGLMLRGAALEATRDFAPMPKTLRPGTFPESDDDLRTSPPAPTPQRRADTAVRIAGKAKDAAAQAAFRQGVAAGGLFVRGGLQALGRELERQGVSLKPGRSLPGSFPGGAAEPSPTPPDEKPFVDAPAVDADHDRIVPGAWVD